MAVIDHVEVHHLAVPQPHPIRSSYGAALDVLGVVVVRVTDTDGGVGEGWTTVIGGGGASVVSFLSTELVPLVIGTDPAQVRGLWQRMFMHSLSRGRKGVPMYAISAVDIAVWDLRARTADQPLHAHLGSVVTEVPVYGDGCWVSFSRAELREAAESYTARDFWGVKVKVGADLDDAIRRVEIVRDVVGPAGRVMVDANQRYNLLTTRRFAAAVADLDLTWLEEPIIADSIHDYGRLHGTIEVPIAAGENEYSRYGFRELLEHEAVDILQPDAHRMGGVTEFMRVLALADAWNIPVAPHTSWELHSQLVCCGTTAMVVEYYDWLPDDFFAVRPDIVNGVVAVSQVPGTGVSIDPASLVKYRVAQ
ncbi:mandelate racemase/muconate lactonizing enzyme family protein [Cryptosporangium sp. NPDC051539]|uniref:mandelate racemase/muconate lactonizing enzyme family protein n=1 Tax=Cryptosporangium sp. NPDC051539 TaxID=3363962 RepID=UPI0037B30D0C